MITCRQHVRLLVSSRAFLQLRILRRPVFISFHALHLTNWNESSTKISCPYTVSIPRLETPSPTTSTSDHTSHCFSPRADNAKKHFHRHPFHTSLHGRSIIFTEVRVQEIPDSESPPFSDSCTEIRVLPKGDMQAFDTLPYEAMHPSSVSTRRAFHALQEKAKNKKNEKGDAKWRAGPSAQYSSTLIFPNCTH